MKYLVAIVSLLSFVRPVLAQDEEKPLLHDSGWSFHAQITGIVQYHPPIHAPYEGQNSLMSGSEKRFSVTSTLFIGHSLWRGASLYFNPELAGGEGFSKTLGIAGFPNGETFRIGSPQPVVYIGRLFLRQEISLGGEPVPVPEDANETGGLSTTRKLIFTLGKYCLTDFFDGNDIAHDPRTDFMNWSLMSNGAFDYPANTRGYTYGLVAEYIAPGWALRAATSLVPVYANGPTLNMNYARANGEAVELEKDYRLAGHKGSARLLLYANTSRAPNYLDVIRAAQNGTDPSLDVIYGHAYGGKKYGAGLNLSQELSARLKGFLRAGWNDGKTATWAFAEIDNSASLGLRYYGIGRNRSGDNAGIAFVSNGISGPHRDFLNAGGYGFMIGDGKLPDYGRENILEVFYQVKLLPFTWVSADYQFAANPAYNHDRGPVNVFSGRVHVEF